MNRTAGVTRLARPACRMLVAAAFMVPLAVAAQAPAAAPATAPAIQEAFLASPDAKLAANKRLVYDFWREVFEARHMDRAEHYMTESYIQHNPNVATGRAAFVEFFSKLSQPKPIQPVIQAPVIAIIAEGDRVILCFARTLPDPKDATVRYTTTWFDMFRIEDGKIAEHWDPAEKRS